MARDLSFLLHPSSVAFIGGAECERAIKRTREFNFAGPIWAVHPKRESVGGIPTIKSVAEITGPLDAAFIAVKREPTIEIVRELAAKGCKGAVVYASGFAETGDHHLQDELLKAANGMPLMGPNCFGFVDALSRAALWPDEHGVEPLASGVAVVTQSGNIACNLTMSRRAFPLASIYTIGNQVDVDMAQMVEALSADPRITAIGLHIEGLNDVAAFARAAELARERQKPIVVLKTGRSEQGARVAMSHTSSLAGADSLYDALFHRSGVARVNTPTAFIETLKFLHHGGPLKDGRLVSMSCSGGEAALAADLASDRKVSFPGFDPATAKQVASTLNEYVAIENPLDYHTFIWGQAEKMTATFSAVLGGGFDVGMLILDTPTHPSMDGNSWLVAARAMAAAAKTKQARAAVVSSLPEAMPLSLAAELSESGVAPMLGLDDALTAFEAAAEIGRNWAIAKRPAALDASRRSKGEAVLLSEFEGKRALAAEGVPVPDGQLCKPGNAVAVASKLGFPVVLKISSDTIAHKTEVGGVALNLSSAQAVEEAAARLGKLSDQLLVERMAQGAVSELIVGARFDPQFGVVLVIGAGGILTELIKESVSLLLPASREEIERAVTSLKVWTLVKGFRGKTGDETKTLDAIEAIARFVAKHADSLEELDINPLLVLPEGAVAVDALLRIRKTK